MNKNIEKTDELLNEQNENVVAGIIGAFLFALAGGVLWYLFYQMGFISGLAGIVGVICAVRGYSFFAKKESKKGIVISVIMAVLVIIISWYLCLATDVFTVHKEWLANGEITPLDMPTFFECVRFSYVYLFDSEVAIPYLSDLGIGLLFCIAGVVTSLINFNNKKANKLNRVNAKNAVNASEEESEKTEE